MSTPPPGSDIRQIRLPSLEAVNDRLAQLRAAFGHRAVWADIVFHSPGYVLAYAIVPAPSRRPYGSGRGATWKGGGK